MESNVQFQRYETSYRMLSSEFNVLKEDLIELKTEFTNVVEENKKLRKDLKDALSNQISQFDRESLQNLNEADKNVVLNYEQQLDLLKKERENAMKMWHNSLTIISQLEQDLKTYQLQAAPQTMSFELELQKRQEEFARLQANQLREIAMLKAELNQKDEDLMDMRLKHNDLNIQIENLKSEINRKDQDRRNMIKKEYGYDDALLSLQNDVNDLETKLMSQNKDNQHLKDKFQELNKQINELRKQNSELERINSDMRVKFEADLHLLDQLKEEKKKVKFKLKILF
ncbi:unnamed protein product [Brachionus calyciflorus]|uniref:Uncharacterized protein n=1 Tax=Brachionus calyciflorus TaxID=104777 RepID=A0A813N2N2_9BILA|nr:unnamed protein product [Brachionus calyciflorus]